MSECAVSRTETDCTSSVGDCCWLLCCNIDMRRRIQMVQGWRLLLPTMLHRQTAVRYYRFRASLTLSGSYGS